MGIKNYDECVSFALKHKGINGDKFSDTTLRVYNRKMANPKSAFTALRKNGIVIPVVKSALFGGTGNEITATVIIMVNQVKGKIDLLNPLTDSVQEYDIADFIEAWEATGGICTTAFPSDAKLYTPKPIVTDGASVPGDFDSLLEALAENAHDVWALERQSEGWTYGVKRDDEKLETPDMVPYSQLSESEKQYDRLMASQTITLLQKLGYELIRHEDTELYKVLKQRIQHSDEEFHCRRCGNVIYKHQIFCDKCGCELKIDWK